MRPETARRLHAAMRDAVTRGTAKSAAPLVPAGWHLGGKTGTGPFALGAPYDGWFAGLIFDSDRPRYTIAVYRAALTGVDQGKQAASGHDARKRPSPSRSPSPGRSPRAAPASGPGAPRVVALA